MTTTIELTEKQIHQITSLGLDTLWVAVKRSKAKDEQLKKKHLKMINEIQNLHAQFE